jgi:hypothetical protein
MTAEGSVLFSKPIDPRFPKRGYLEELNISAIFKRLEQRTREPDP